MTDSAMYPPRRKYEPCERFAWNKHPKWPQLWFVVAWAGACTSPLLWPACLLFRRNNRQQQIRRFAAAKMQAGGAVKNGGRTIARVVVQEWAAPLQFILEVRQPAATGPAILVVLAAN